MTIFYCTTEIDSNLEKMTVLSLKIFCYAFLLTLLLVGISKLVRNFIMFCSKVYEI